jgi:hypothetical protein
MRGSEGRKRRLRGDGQDKINGLGRCRIHALEDTAWRDGGAAGSAGPAGPRRCGRLAANLYPHPLFWDQT